MTLEVCVLAISINLYNKHKSFIIYLEDQFRFQSTNLRSQKKKKKKKKSDDFIILTPGVN